MFTGWRGKTKWIDTSQKADSWAPDERIYGMPTARPVG